MVKIAILVIDADDEPVYSVGREMWRYAARLYDVPVFFLRADRRVNDDGVYVENDVIYARWFERFETRLNHKTLLGLHYCYQNLDFDYVLRTNLSSVYRVDVLRDFLARQGRDRFYGGYLNWLPIEDGDPAGFEYVSGSGVLISKDLLPRLINAKAVIDDTYVDDVWLGLALRDLPRVALDRCDLTDVTELSVAQMRAVSDKIDAAMRSGGFHFRVKNEGEAGRLALDSMVFGMLFERVLAPLLRQGANLQA